MKQQFRNVFPLALLLPTAAAIAQDPHAFSEVESSAIDYSERRYESRVSCASLKSLSNYEFSVASARENTEAETAERYCHVTGLIAPRVQFDLYLPLDWNGRTYMHGNGGYAGRPADNPRRFATSMRAVRQGFAAIYSDGGYDQRNISAPGVFEDPMAQLNWAYRATQLSAAAGHAITAHFYQTASDFDYFDGCSWGGHQGFAMAQDFPELFDGILAGSPVFDFTGMHFGARRLAEILDEADLDKTKISILADAVHETCDALDGLTDRSVAHPPMCDFNPVRDARVCSDGGENCLSEKDAELLAEIYQPTIVGGQQVFPGWPVGGEFDGVTVPTPPGSAPVNHRSGWYSILTESVAPNGRVRPPVVIARNVDAFRYFLFPEIDPSRHWSDVDLERDREVIQQTGAFLDADNPDLSGLAASGGKLLAYHGWADINVNPRRTYEYFGEIHEALGEEVAHDTARLFMPPGMFHCRGGSDLNEFDGMTALINWVEGGDAPDAITVRGNEAFRKDETEIVCAYPKYARYTGNGDPGKAASYQCVDAE